MLSWKTVRRTEKTYNDSHYRDESLKQHPTGTRVACNDVMTFGQEPIYRKSENLTLRAKLALWMGAGAILRGLPHFGTIVRNGFQFIVLARFRQNFTLHFAWFVPRYPDGRIAPEQERRAKSTIVALPGEGYQARTPAIQLSSPDNPWKPWPRRRSRCPKNAHHPDGAKKNF